jgi:hypothetical protein
MWDVWYHVKLFVAAYQVFRFCDDEARPSVANLAIPLAHHRTMRDLLFREPGVLRIYFEGRSADEPLDGIGCDCVTHQRYLP